MNCYFINESGDEQILQAILQVTLLTNCSYKMSLLMNFNKKKNEYIDDL